MNLIFSVTVPEKNKKDINVLLSKENFMKQFKESRLSEEIVNVNDYLVDPFYGSNPENDALVFLSEFFGSLNDTTIKNVYNILEKSRKNENDKKVIIELIKNRANLNKSRELRKMLSNRIVKLLEFQDNIGLLEKYNEKLVFGKNKRTRYCELFSYFIPKHHPLKELRGRHVVSIQFFVLE